MGRKVYSITILILLITCMLSIGFAGCANSKVNDKGTENQEVKENGEYITVGFSQLGAESDWRSANSESMRQVFTENNGYRLIFEDAQQKQTNQITAIRSFIQQEVDFIVLAPVTEDGWDTVLQEANESGIPIIVIDRMVDVSDDNLYEGWIGSDFALEGKKVCEWINQYTKSIGMDSSDVNIVDIQGTLGSSAQIGRTRSLTDAADKYGWNILAMRMGDFTQTKGREAMLSVLSSYDNVNVVYCENDNEALGAIEAIEMSGKKVGSNIRNGEIMVVSFDGVNKDAMDNLKEGKISCIGECNPNSGPKVETMIKKIIAGEQPDKYEYMDESVYSSVDSVKSVTVDGKSYNVTVIQK